jgi:hypothetical protein
MVRIPIRSRVPLQGWVLAGSFTILSVMSSLLERPYASLYLQLAQLVE